MKGSPYSLDVREEEETFDLKEAILGYLRYWPWFIVTVIISVIIGFVYLRYSPIIYETVAKIKILDDSKALNITLDPMSLLNGNSKINTDNEIEVLESYRLLSQVVEDLDLDVSYYVVGKLKTTPIWDPPFRVTKKINNDSLQQAISYFVTLKASGITLVNEGEKDIVVPLSGALEDSKLPFNIKAIENIDPKAYEDTKYQLVISPVKDVVLQLIGEMQVEATNKTSEIISLSLKGQNPYRNEDILNTLIDKFNRDGVLDRQLVSKRTVDFIDERFLSLSGELDSIEGQKENFKQSNNLSYIEADAGLSMQKKSVAEDELFNLQTQIALSKMLKNTLADERDFGLLPADRGLESGAINNLVSSYNKTSLERQKLAASAGENNPTLQGLSSQLENGKQNIIETVSAYQKQLGVSLSQLNQQKNKAGAMFYRLPEKEKILRSIERQQSIKENLYLLLLQKREEAAINYAVTAPSIKVVDYGLSSNRPVSPKKTLVLGISLLMGLLIPFGVIYMRNTLDSKVRDRRDIEKVNPEIPIVGEIPFFEDHKSFGEASDRSILAEAFRILSTNVNYLLPKKSEGKGEVIYVTSSVKEEGKTLVSLNLSLAYASIMKKVLLVGADLRNPQLHTYFESDKNVTGLSNYLYDPEIDFRNCLHDGFKNHKFHKVCFSGAIPPNAPELLASGAFERFIETAREQFDYVIVDTAPTLLVTDTLLISQLADITLMVVRAGFTDKRLLDFSKTLNKTQRIRHMAYVINDVKMDRISGHNYGYGYGYEARDDRGSWFKRVLKMGR